MSPYANGTRHLSPWFISGKSKGGKGWGKKAQSRVVNRFFRDPGFPLFRTRDSGFKSKIVTRFGIGSLRGGMPKTTGLKNPIGDSCNPKAKRSECPPWKRCTKHMELMQARLISLVPPHWLLTDNKSPCSLLLTALNFINFILRVIGWLSVF